MLEAQRETTQQLRDLAAAMEETQRQTGQMLDMRQVTIPSQCASLLARLAPLPLSTPHPIGAQATSPCHADGPVSISSASVLPQQHTASMQLHLQHRAEVELAYSTL